MKQQTAVDFLQWALQNTVLTEKQVMQTIGLFVQAREMEQDQIQDAFYFGVDVDSSKVISPYKEAEKYFQKTFANENV